MRSEAELDAYIIKNFCADLSVADDLYQFVMRAYPWDEPGSPLEGYKGPKKWQKEILDTITKHIAATHDRQLNNLPPEIFQLAAASGRGIGKSALVSWISHWMLTTRIGSTVVISANSEAQLRDYTFPEIRKWFAMAVNAHWFELGAMSVTAKPAITAMAKKDLHIDTAYYYVKAKLWSAENPSSFAGAHSRIGMIVIFDEASGIPSSIWPVAGGYFTDLIPYRFWLAFSNPRNNSGGFYECFHDEKSPWLTRQIDARGVEQTDPAYYQGMIDQYGENSYTARVEVMGLFPRHGDNQFIDNATVDEAKAREVEPDDGAPLIMGVDIARYGDDQTVVRFRQGRDARSIPPIKWNKTGFLDTADRLTTIIERHNPDGICIDSGFGGAVCEILKRRGFKVHEVMFGAKPEKHEYANKATEMYGDLRDWLPKGAIDSDPLLYKDLTARDYKMHGKGGDQIILEPKELFKRKTGGRSPDDGDALALTFAVKISRRDMRASATRQPRMAQGLDYSLFGE